MFCFEFALFEWRPFWICNLEWMGSLEPMCHFSPSSSSSSSSSQQEVIIMEPAFPRQSLMDVYSYLHSFPTWNWFRPIIFHLICQIRQWGLLLGIWAWRQDDQRSIGFDYMRQIRNRIESRRGSGFMLTDRGFFHPLHWPFQNVRRSSKNSPAQIEVSSSRVPSRKRFGTPQSIITKIKQFD